MNASLLARVSVTPAPVRDQIVTSLRRAILDGRLELGARITERELTEQTGASRSAVREALSQLQAEGLVVSNGTRGLTVSRPSPAEAAEIYEIRAALEGMAAAACASSADEETITSLRRHLGEFAAAVERADHLDELRTKNELYEALLAASGYTVLPGLVRALQGRVTALRSASLSSPGRGRQSLEEVAAIVDAVAAHDPAAARRAAETHVRSAARVTAAVLAEARPRGASAHEIEDHA